MRRSIGIIAVSLILLIGMTATVNAAQKLKTENEVNHYVSYTVPKGFMEIPLEPDDGVCAETMLKKGNFSIDITVYRNTGKNNREIYKNLNDRSGENIIINKTKYRSGRTDIDRMLVTKKGGYIVEFFAGREAKAFTGIGYTKKDNKKFMKFMKKVKILSRGEDIKK